ncbi:MAG: hypothetical protein M1381_11615 [Deltaproteobacteria bacterium]|nr:hypothetical protein [Deltaproteobacteria bacterium]
MARKQMDELRKIVIALIIFVLLLMMKQSSTGMPVGECFLPPEGRQAKLVRLQKCHGLARGYLLLNS